MFLRKKNILLAQFSVRRVVFVVLGGDHPFQSLDLVTIITISIKDFQRVYLSSL